MHGDGDGGYYGEAVEYGLGGVFGADAMRGYLAACTYTRHDGGDGHRSGKWPSGRGYSVVGIGPDHDQRHADAERDVQLQYPLDGGLRHGVCDGHHHRKPHEYGSRIPVHGKPLHQHAAYTYCACDDGGYGDRCGDRPSRWGNRVMDGQYGEDQRNADTGRHVYL